MEVYELDHRKNVEHHVNIWETIKHTEFGSIHVNACTEIANSLVILRNFDLLDLFLNEVGPGRVNELQHNEKFLRAFIAYKLHYNQYNDVYTLLEKGQFSSTEGLLDLWDEAHYCQKRTELRRELTPLIRYRVRQKYPPPMNICPDGKRPSTKLPAQAVVQLKKWLSDHPQSPYPSQNDKEDLAAKTCLSLYQVKTWFANARRRIKSKTKSATKPVTNGDRSDTQVTSSGSEQQPTLSSTENLQHQQVNMTKNTVSKRGTRRESSTSVDELQPESIKHPRVEHTGLQQVPSIPGNAQISYPGDDLTSTASGKANFQPVLSPSIFGYETCPDLNASRSLQALAGMCDNIKPPSSSTFSPCSNVPHEVHYPSSSRLSPRPRASTPHALKTPDPRSHTLWQPFKSTDDLSRKVDHCGEAKNSQSTAVRSNSCSAMLPNDNRSCRECTRPHSSVVDGMVPLPLTSLQNNSPCFVAPPISDFYSHPCVFPSQCLPQPSPSITYPLPPQSLPLSSPCQPSGGTFSLNVTMGRGFQSTIRPGQLTFGQPWTTDCPLASNDMFYLPYFRGALYNEDPRFLDEDDNRSDAAQVLLDLSKARNLMSPGLSCRE